MKCYNLIFITPDLIMMKKSPNPHCPCCSDMDYTHCCKPYHDGLAAPTALALMRSRYSAYVLRLTPYLLATWHPETCPQNLNLNDSIQTKWLGLQIKQYKNTDPTHAIVEFVARYRIGGEPASRLHETSQFVLENDRWLYVDALHIDGMHSEDNSKTL